MDIGQFVSTLKHPFIIRFSKSNLIYVDQYQDKKVDSGDFFSNEGKNFFWQKIKRERYIY